MTAAEGDSLMTNNLFFGGGITTTVRRSVVEFETIRDMTYMIDLGYL